MHTPQKPQLKQPTPTFFWPNTTQVMVFYFHVHLFSFLFIWRVSRPISSSVCVCVCLKCGVVRRARSIARFCFSFACFFASFLMMMMSVFTSFLYISFIIIVTHLTTKLTNKHTKNIKSEWKHTHTHSLSLFLCDWMSDCHDWVCQLIFFKKTQTPLTITRSKEQTHPFIL